jgi:hypothetical protein
MGCEITIKTGGKDMRYTTIILIREGDKVWLQIEKS